ncbi:hypothetical protein FQN50_002196 [Emmonsiellopsis sp. PD_5]|nr:hypothetical protein FQN50_002196 [Emmonsiellopsis sp. PD_5]
MDASKHGASLLDIFELYECSTSILSCLPRSSLKSLRLTCKAVDKIVVSPASHLFSRVYLSIYHEDLDALDAIVKHPRLSCCVRELVWDTSIWTMLYVERENPPDELEAAAQEKKHEEQAAKVVSGLLDFKALLRAFLRLPLLKHIVLANLMMGRQYEGEYDRWKTDVTRPGFPFQSPAMREGLGQENRLYRKGAPRPTPVGEETLTHLSHVALTFIGQIDAEAHQEEVQAQAPPLVTDEFILEALLHMDQRALAMLMVSLQHTNKHLDSISFGFDTPDLPPSGWSYFIQGLSPSWLETHTTLTDRFAQMLARPLRRLSLGIEFKEWPQASVNNLFNILKSVTDLGILELRPVGDAFFEARLPSFPAMNFPLESLPVNQGQSPWLRKLILRNLHVRRRQLEKEILPWCFDQGVRILQLDMCVFLGSSKMEDLGYWLYLVSKDITLLSEDESEVEENEKGSGEKEPNPTPWPYDSDDRTSFYSDDSDYNEKEYTYEYKDAPRVPWMDVNFGFDIEDSDSEYATTLDGALNDDDDTYFPWNYLDTKMGVPAGEDPWKWYKEHYEEERLCAYDEEYLADTADLPIELLALSEPMDARLARRAVGVMFASMELTLKEGDWRRSTTSSSRNGCEERVLKLRIDGFKYRGSLREDDD